MTLQLCFPTKYFDGISKTGEQKPQTVLSWVKTVYGEGTKDTYIIETNKTTTKALKINIHNSK